ncbi:MAG: polyprenyl synthetase family protein [Bacilli bacterium]|nr:polyprenyl synthetase family protein [Bacilli bacterium]
MILIPKVGCNEIKYDSNIAKKTDFVIIVNDEESSNVGDLFSLWNQKSKVIICNDISDYYDFIKREKKFTSNSNILIIGTKNTSYDSLLEYKNLTEFYFLYIKTIKEIDKNMNKFNKTFINKKDNPIVRELMDNFTVMNSGGKYIRAFLISLGYHLSSKKEDDYYMPLAVAYETFQTSILVHDDIIDKADTRRGKTTIHKKYEEKFNKCDLKDKDFDNNKIDTSKALALCIGDVGFFLSSNIITTSYSNNSNLARLLKLYNDILIYTGKGEIIDVMLPFVGKYDSKYNVIEKDIMEIYRLKTAWYTITGPLALGMTLGGASDKAITSLEKLAEPLGIAFQIKDDILGIYSSAKKMGKNNSDIEEYKQTILYSYTINTEYKDELLKYYGKNTLTEKDVEKVREIFTKSGAYDYAIKKQEELFNESKELIRINRSMKKDYKNILQGFITYLELRDK